MYENNEYFKCFRFIFHLMKMNGIFPFIFTHQGTTQHLLLSRILAGISLIIYFSLVPTHWSHLVENLNKIFHDLNPAIFVRFLPIVIFRLLFFSVPFISWTRSKQLHAYWENWGKFENQMENMNGMQFKLKVNKKIRWINCYGLIGPLSLAALLKYRLSENTLPLISTLPSFLYMATLALSIALYWRTNCLFLESTAKNLLDFLKKAIKRQEEGVMCSVMDLWMHLCDLSDEFSSAHFILFLVFMSIIMVNMVAALYCFSYSLVIDNNKSTALAFFIFGMQCAGVLLLFCESADSVFKYIVPEVQETLLRKDTAAMNEKSLREVLMFLQVIEARKHKITLNGFMDINRSTMKSIFAVTINYLIVLKQFSK